MHLTKLVVESWTKLAPYTGLTANSTSSGGAGIWWCAFAVDLCHPHGQAWRGDGGYTFVGGESRPGAEDLGPDLRGLVSSRILQSPFVYLKSLLAQGGQQRKRWDSA